MTTINLLRPKWSGTLQAFTVKYPKCSYCGEYSGCLTVHEHGVCLMSICYKCSILAIKKVMGEPIYGKDDK